MWFNLWYKKKTKDSIQTMNKLIQKLIKASLAESFVSEDIAKERLAICAKCPLLEVDKCSVCGCYVELKAYMDYNKNPKKRF